MRESCALTLARKLKLKTQREVFKLLGKDLSYKPTEEEKGKQPKKLEIELGIKKPDYKRTRTFKPVNEDPYTEIARNWNKK